MSPSLAPLHVLLFDAYGRGGVARTVINLVNHLAQHRDVELISLQRRRDEPRYAIDPKVLLSVLNDTRGSSGLVSGLLAQRPTRLRPEPSETEMSLLTDRLLRRKIRSLRNGILLSTRPSLHLAAVRFARPGVVTIGQEHLNFPTRFANPLQVKVLGSSVPALDAYAVLTEADASDYRHQMPGMATRVRVIRNAVPWAVSSSPAPLRNKVVVAAGRLSAEKGFERLITAYEPIARRHPDWQLHIYGSGNQKDHLAAHISEHGLDAQVRLMGYTSDLQTVLADSSVYAMSSHSEGFPMALIEAMSTGVPPVAFDCPRGPAEIIDDGRNGLLVPDGDLSGFTRALRSLIEHDDVRRSLGAQALEDARAYGIDRISGEWESLFASTSSRRTA